VRRLYQVLLTMMILTAACAVPAVHKVDGSAVHKVDGSDIHKVGGPAGLRSVVYGTNETMVRLISRTGQSTGWISSAELKVVGDMVCMESRAPPWRQVTAVRVTDLTDANIAGILTDLPRWIRVVHLGNGEARLETDGEDLTPWVQSTEHSSSDHRVPRYYLLEGEDWRGPLTWVELKGGRRPLVGWPIAGTSAEVRDGSIDTSSSIAATIAAAPFVIIAAGIAVAARVPSVGPSDSPQRRRDTTKADAPLKLVRSVGQAQSASPGTWGALPCVRPAPAGAKP
jgi:hypothetical protein